VGGVWQAGRSDWFRAGAGPTPQARVTAPRYRLRTGGSVAGLLRCSGCSQTSRAWLWWLSRMSRGTLDGTELVNIARSTCCCPVAMPKSSGGTRDSPKRWLNLGRVALRGSQITAYQDGLRSVAPPGAMNLTASRSLMEGHLRRADAGAAQRAVVTGRGEGLEFTRVLVTGCVTLREGNQKRSAPTSLLMRWGEPVDSAIGSPRPAGFARPFGGAEPG